MVSLGFVRCLRKARLEEASQQVKAGWKVAWWRLANHHLLFASSATGWLAGWLASSFRFSSETLSWPPTAVRALRLLVLLVAPAIRDSLFVAIIALLSPFRARHLSRDLNVTRDLHLFGRSFPRDFVHIPEYFCFLLHLRAFRNLVLVLVCFQVSFSRVSLYLGLFSLRLVVDLSL